MNIYYNNVMIFIFGTIIGSFLNVCIYRIPKEESIIYPSSYCTNCNKKIKVYDLIPIISYIILKGKCRYCHKNISLRYPIIEIITGLAYLFIYVKFGINIDFIKYMIFISIMIVVGIIDLDTTNVYFKVTGTGIIFGIIFLGIYSFMGISVKTYIYGSIFITLFLFLIILITKGGMGYGDMEMSLICGLFLGLRYTVLTLFLAFVIGACVGVTLILMKKRSRKDYIPFGPFIFIASIIVVFFGKNILDWYLFL